jgi:ATP-dependent Zn protease
MSYHMKALSQELKATAYHEAGHALVAYFRNKRDRIQMVTIVPAGGALGYVWRAPKEDFHSTTKIEYLTAIEISLGGYCAENLHMETTTSGVQDDLDKVAGMARAMVTEWGMGSYKFNVSRAYGDRYTSQASPETQRQIELEIKAITDQCMENVNQLLVAKRKELDLLAQALYDKETLYFKDIVTILEPTRHPTDIERELAEVAERKLVGKIPKVILEPPPAVQPPPLNPGPSASNNKTEPDSPLNS